MICMIIGSLEVHRVLISIPRTGGMKQALQPQMPQGKFFEFVAVATGYDRYLLWMSYFNVNFMEPAQAIVKFRSYKDFFLCGG